MALKIERASKQQRKLRLALSGPAGSGKSLTALKVAKYIAERDGGRILGIDTEGQSLSDYADEYDFDIVVMPDYRPETYIDAIKMANDARYSVCIVDSMTHAWAGADGLLERKEAEAQKGGNSWTAWRSITPVHNKLVESIMGVDAHLIATIRAKMEYVQEEYTDKQGNQKKRVTKIGLKPIQREGMEYEFSIFCDIDQDHRLVVSKGRVRALDGKTWVCPGDDFAEPIYAWLKIGDAATPKAAPPTTATAPSTTAPVDQSAPKSQSESPRKALLSEIKATVERLDISKDMAAAFVRDTTGQSLKDLDDVALAAIPAALESHFGAPAEPEHPASEDLFGGDDSATAVAPVAETGDGDWGDGGY